MSEVTKQRDQDHLSLKELWAYRNEQHELSGEEINHLVRCDVAAATQLMVLPLFGDRKPFPYLQTSIGTAHVSTATSSRAVLDFQIAEILPISHTTLRIYGVVLPVRRGSRLVRGRMIPSVVDEESTRETL